MKLWAEGLPLPWPLANMQVEALMPNVDVGVFGRPLGLAETRRVDYEESNDRTHVFVRRDVSKLSSSLPFSSFLSPPAMWEYNKKAAVYKPGSEPLQEPLPWTP